LTGTQTNGFIRGFPVILQLRQSNAKSDSACPSILVGVRRVISMAVWNRHLPRDSAKSLSV
jgi:hypothetical protein